MSLPYLPLYVGDYEADTAHLTILEDGAYTRLLRLLWRSPGCSIPDDEAWVFRMMRARTEDEKTAIRTVIDEFCQRKGGRILSLRLQHEFNALTKKIDDYGRLIPRKIREYLFVRDGKKCVYCGETDTDFEIDHVVPWSRGGPTEVDNLVVSCFKCNRAKSDKTPQEMGWC